MNALLLLNKNARPQKRNTKILQIYIQKTNFNDIIYPEEIEPIGGALNGKYRIIR